MLPNTFKEFSRTTDKVYSNKSMRLRISAKRQHRVRLNKPAIAGLGLKGGDSKIKFFRFGRLWFVCKTNDEDGYIVGLEDVQRAGGSCNCAFTARMIISDFQVKDDSPEFYLLESEHEFKGFKLYQLNKML